MYSQPLEPTPSDDNPGAGVAHGEAFAGAARREEIPVRRAVKHGVANDDVVLGPERADTCGGFTTMIPPDRPLPT